MLDDVFAPTLRLQLPAALLAVWSKDPHWLDDVAAPELLPPGVLPARSGLFAVLPRTADADVVEAAHAFGRTIARAAPAGAGARLLIFPATVVAGDTFVEVVPNPLLQDLEHTAPELAQSVVHLTGHARHELESGWTLRESGNYRGPSGRELPIWSLDHVAPRAAWRNPELLGRGRSTVPRPELAERLQELGEPPVLLIVGPMGTGKSRFVAQTFGRDDPMVWSRPWSPRSSGPGLAHQLLLGLLRLDESRIDLAPERRDTLRRDLERSLWGYERARSEEMEALLEQALEGLGGSESTVLLAVDDAHATGADDRALLARLAERAAELGSYRLLIVGRRGGEWQTPWQELPTLEVGPLSEEASITACDNLISGLSVPEEARDRFIAASVGFPFALEEGLLQLVRGKVLRRVYGNFFFSGNPDVTLEPTPRLVRHLEAEARRLGDPTPLRIITNVEAAIPLDELNGALTLILGSNPRGWHAPYIDAGLLAMGRPERTTLEVVNDLYARGLESTLHDASVAPLRHLVGRQLAELPVDPFELWKTYRLLAGTPDAVPLLLKVARRGDAAIPRDELFIALTEELENHRERQGDERTELDILWVLLPLARRLGRLSQLGSALDRALELTTKDPDRRIALTALKAEKEQNEGRYREAETTLLGGLELARSSDEKRKALLVVQLGKVLQRQDRFPEARRLYEEILPVLDRTGNRNLGATCRFHLGNIAMHEGRLENALQLHQESLRERRQLEVHSQIGSSLSALGTVCLALGDYPRSLSYYRDAEGALEQHGREGEVSFALIGVGRALSRLGDFTSASQPFRQALTLRRDRDDRTGEAIARLLVAGNHLNLGQNDIALEEARRAHFQLSMVDDSKQLADAEQLLGRIRLRQRQYEEARQHLETAIAIHQQHGDVLAATFDRAWLLETSIAVSDHRRIEELCSAIEAVLETLRYPELGETLDLRLYQGLEWLRQRGKETDPIKPLLRGYRELYRKTELLSAELRNPFLFQVPDNRAIINSATLHGLSLEPPENL